MKAARACAFVCVSLSFAPTALAPANWFTSQERQADRSRSREPAINRSTRQQERPPEELRRKIDSLLRDELTQHWYPNALDRGRGGFHQNMARDWSLRPDENVFLPYQARMTWTAAAFAQYSPAHRTDFAQYARHGIEFLQHTMRDHEFGGFYWILGPDGRIDPKLGDEKMVYGMAFVIYAASKVRQVTGDELALKVAGDAFDWLEVHAHDGKNGGYFEALRRDGTPIVARERNSVNARRTDAIGVPHGAKSTNTHIHVLEALTSLSKVDERAIVKERLREVFLIFRDRLIAKQGALYVLTSPDWRPTTTDDSFGHDVEAAYLLVEAAHALGMRDDPKSWQVASLLVDHALKWGWDSQNGGFYDKARGFDAKAFDQRKVWWAQAEALNTLLLLHWKYAGRSDRYWTAFLKVWDFTENYLLDPVHGGWYLQTTRDGKLIGDDGKASQWKANYHTSRALINVAKLLSMFTERPADE
jgi:mannobiose 2-epimerase